MNFGSRDARGNWFPNRAIDYGPFFAWPTKPKPVLQWFFAFPGYLFPWHVLDALAAVVIW